ncbi:MAG: ferric siderophore ABC transporter substrate-binding protein [Tistrella sp.]|nr:ferric siderophore ABC transporter substrate-binding protein [Tistrella sp.]
MLALVRPDPSEGAMAADYDTDPAPIVLPIPTERYGYAPPPGRRVLAFVGTSVIYALVAAGLFLSFEVSTPPPKPSAPLVVTLLPLASPPETPPKPKQAPKPVEKHEKRPTPPKVEPIEHTIVPLPTMATPPPSPAVKPADPAPPQPETAAPKTAPAPPAPQVSSNAPDTWEGRVLARLEKFRRYPGAARSARQQGVVYIRFRMNRDGHVLSSSLVRSSGFPALDQAALETLRRADPLPKIPADRPDEIELSVPVEFYIN